jgi:hypothetical protein
MTDRDFEIAELRRDRALIVRQLDSAECAREMAYVDKFRRQLKWTDARLAELGI